MQPLNAPEFPASRVCPSITVAVHVLDTLAPKPPVFIVNSLLGKVPLTARASFVDQPGAVLRGVSCQDKFLPLTPYRVHDVAVGGIQDKFDRAVEAVCMRRNVVLVLDKAQPGQRFP